MLRKIDEIDRYLLRSQNICCSILKTCWMQCYLIPWFFEQPSFSGETVCLLIFVYLQALSTKGRVKGMGKIPNELRETIAKNIRDCRMKKFPGRGGGKKCAEAFGVSPQQWSPWERGMRTPDEVRLAQIATFFGVTVEFLRRSNVEPREMLGDANQQPAPYYNFYSQMNAQPPMQAMLREADAQPYGLPSLRRDDAIGSGANVADLALTSARLLGMIGAATKGVTDGKIDINKTIHVLRRLGDLLDGKLREAGVYNPPQSF